jgi:DNA-binding response OmpR family regulator
MYRIKTKARERILVVDDERDIRSAMTKLLDPQYCVEAVTNGEDALNFLEETVYDLLILDFKLPQIDGLEVLDRVREQYPDMAVIMMTRHASIDTAILALQHGATNFLKKSASKDEILRSVEEGLAHSRRERRRSAMLLKAKQLLEAGLEHLEGIAPSEERSHYLAPPENEEEGSDDGEGVTDVYEDPDRFLKTGPLLIDFYRREARLHDELLDLTAGEYDLLLCLARNAPKVLDPRAIVEETRGFECTLHEARDLIRWQVYLLRQKIEEDPSSPKFIVNVRGKGYMWATP